MIDLAPAHLEIVRDILKKHVPGAEVRVFGSRAAHAPKGWSDLDLAIAAEEQISLATLTSLQIDFEESDLPFRVDIIDWNAVSEEFRNRIDEKFEIIQKRGS